ncbi:hypothetical protein GOP47_0022014 [Adiantum capillus-veneris]|uniref:Uncharacterized protein n=1 Tax=Adiantum capillus-veneris TaxID=13818 RepID=A0A9D4U8X8_ADICA|nr:hypothetical protein GOP47_0022014 [Adiantum capillus-veneris]
METIINREDILEESSSEKLLDAILKTGRETNIFADAAKMFNTHFEISFIIEHSKDTVLEAWIEFENSIMDQILLVEDKQYAHLIEFSKDVVEKGKILIRFAGRETIRPSH